MDFDRYNEQHYNKYQLPETCAICFDDINENNYVLFTISSTENTNWQPCTTCSECVNILLESKWSNYMEAIEKADCYVGLKTLLQHGPPINLRCCELELDNKNKEIEYHEFYINGQIVSAKLKGSLIGNERDEWIKQQQIVLEYLRSDAGRQMVFIDN